MKKYLEPIGYIIAVLLIALLTAFTEKELSEVKFEQLRVNINTDEGNFFVTSSEVEEAVYHMGYVSGDVTIKNINTRTLEDFFDSYPYIAKSQVFSTGKGVLIIEIKQRVPILRIFQKYDDSYYLDETGKLMPVSEDFTAHVPVVNGEVNAPYNLHYGADYSAVKDRNDLQKSEKLLCDLYTLTTTLRQNELWKAQLNQIYVDENGEFELIPRVGNHNIILGSTDGLNEKLRKLKIFYFEGLDKTGWNEYSTINLKFDNQVVCTKR